MEPTEHQSEYFGHFRKKISPAFWAMPDFAEKLRLTENNTRLSIYKHHEEEETISLNRF